MSEQEHAEHCARKEREERTTIFNSEKLDYLSLFPNSCFLGNVGVAAIRAALERPLSTILADDGMMEYRANVINLMLCEQNAYKWHGESARPFVIDMASRLRHAGENGDPAEFSDCVRAELGRMNNALYSLGGHLEFYSYAENDDDDVMLVANAADGNHDVVDLSSC